MDGEFSNIYYDDWNLEECASRTFPSTWIKEQIFTFLGVIHLFLCWAYKVEWYTHPIFLLGSTEGDSAWQRGLSKPLCGRLDNPWKKLGMNKEKNGKWEWTLPTDFTFCLFCSVITDTFMVCLLSTFVENHIPENPTSGRW